MKIGDTIRARFMTLPETFPGMGASIDTKYPVRRATVVYVHLKGRYIVAECKVLSGGRGGIKKEGTYMAPSFELAEIIQKIKKYFPF